MGVSRVSPFEGPQKSCLAEKLFKNAVQAGLESILARIFSYLLMTKTRIFTIMQKSRPLGEITVGGMRQRTAKSWSDIWLSLIHI
eukprot:3455999-Rhodomonas_salina.1